MFQRKPRSILDQIEERLISLRVNADVVNRFIQALQQGSVEKAGGAEASFAVGKHRIRVFLSSKTSEDGKSPDSVIIFFHHELLARDKRGADSCSDETRYASLEFKSGIEDLGTTDYFLKSWSLWREMFAFLLSNLIQKFDPSVYGEDIIVFFQYLRDKVFHDLSEKQLSRGKKEFVQMVVERRDGWLSLIPLGEIYERYRVKKDLEK